MVFEKLNRDKIDVFYQKVRKYGGWEDVPAQRRWQIFLETLEPARLGFSSVKRGLIVREATKEVSQLIKLQLYKGGCCGVRFGVSLSWVPSSFEPVIRWHRKAGVPELDLFEEPQQFFGETDLAAESCFASHLLGEKCFREELEAMWSMCLPLIRRWFEETLTPENILQKCLEQVNRAWNGPSHWPDPKLVYAFTLARTGSSFDGKQQIEEFLTSHPHSDLARKNLLNAIEYVSAQKARPKAPD